MEVEILRLVEKIVNLYIYLDTFIFIWLCLYLDIFIFKYYDI